MIGGSAKGGQTDWNSVVTSTQSSLTCSVAPIFVYLESEGKSVKVNFQTFHRSFHVDKLFFNFMFYAFRKSIFAEIQFWRIFNKFESWRNLRR